MNSIADSQPEACLSNPPTQLVQPKPSDNSMADAIPINKTQSNQDLSGKSSISQSLLHRLAGPSSNKAGLIRDPDEVAKIIYECSKGSKYFLNEQAKDTRMNAQIDQLLKKLEHQLQLRKGNLDFEEQEATRLFEALERSRVLDQIIVCVDADAFFCSVEEKHDPSLKGKAFAVGSTVLTTASYEARKWGCRSAMAGHIAVKLCPHLKFVEPDFAKYQDASDSIMEILRRYDPNLAPMSLDECFMNLTTYCHQRNLSAVDVVASMRQEILEGTGLSVSAGIGPNVMIAKIAADINKPNGQFFCPLTKESAMEFMTNLSVRKVPGIGRVTERWLEAMGVRKCGDIWDQRAKLLLMRSEVGLDLLIRAYLGLGETEVKSRQRESRQSVGCESSFKAITKNEEFFEKLSQLSHDLAKDLSRLGFAGRTLTLKLKLDTFEVLSRSITPASLGRKLLSSADDLYKYSKLLLDREIDNRRSAFDQGKSVPGCGGTRELSIRLLGIKVSQLQDMQQLSNQTNLLEKWIAQPPEPPDTIQPPGSTKENWACPVCNETFTYHNIARVNEHVDLCLWKNSEESRSPEATSRVTQTPEKKELKRPNSPQNHSDGGKSSKGKKSKSRSILDWYGGKQSK
ncbi:hypothetical protein O181_025055 [Austropuccinia psidii MF-1]|uniref:DNA polymerase kappa n=1 Tax=Austropuccinia psidii MF-1 TaxID=1389203 RepID=A0A9Q3CLX3_9BASI|nr:hypothetical protein [Austropuccinia psidii MF-1]